MQITQCFFFSLACASVIVAAVVILFSEDSKSIGECFFHNFVTFARFLAKWSSIAGRPHFPPFILRGKTVLAYTVIFISTAESKENLYRKLLLLFSNMCSFARFAGNHVSSWALADSEVQWLERKRQFQPRASRNRRHESSQSRDFFASPWNHCCASTLWLHS